MQDQTLTCRDCQKQFVWTVKEQEFYQQKGYTNPPARCIDCRRAKKQQLRADRQMFQIKCAKCGQEGQVPFQPRGDRPVYCNNCYQQSKQQA